MKDNLRDEEIFLPFSLFKIICAIKGNIIYISHDVTKLVILTRDKYLLDSCAQ